MSQASDTDVTYSDLLQDPLGIQDYVRTREDDTVLALIAPLIKIQTTARWSQ